MTSAAWLAASIPSCAGIIAAVIGLINRRKISEIHVLVNSRLDLAIAQIEDLKQQRDQARADAAPATEETLPS
jgi:hypothetical protein